MQKTYLAIHLRDGIRECGIGTHFTIQESELPDDNTGGMAKLPFCEVYIDGEFVQFLDDPPEVGVTYRVEEIRDEVDPEQVICLRIVQQ